jgi:cytochrome c553
MGVCATIRTVRRTLASLVLIWAPGVWAAELPPAASRAGQSIYQKGLLASGQPVRATVQKGTPLGGAAAACVQCHRRSGLGGSEGQNAIRPIAGRLLFSQTEVPGRWEPAGGVAVRPVYTRASLARALREGVDPAGRSLDALMPRYALSDEEVDQLYAYIERLSSGAAPGVTDREIHFSTIIAPGVDPDRRQAMLDVLQAFFRDKNGGTRQEVRRREVGSEQMYRNFRSWVLHVWELGGAPETWRGQLEAHYRKQPVFAVIGGLGGSWMPVHAFCEAFEVPCIFPDVDYPDVRGPAYYPLYFSRGMTLEAEILAKHLAGNSLSGDGGTVVQIYRDNALGRLPAQVLRDKLQGRGGKTIIDHPLTDARPIDVGSLLSGREQPTVLVAWLNTADLETLGFASTPPPELDAIYMSASLSAMRRPPVPEKWLDKLGMVYPFDLPESRARRLARMKIWLRARNIPLADERTQANAFFAATVTGDAVSRLGDNFSRDYFIEGIEQMTENVLSPSIYPRLSLGPGQRFASKGGYVVRFPAGKGDRPVALSEWLIP